MKGLWLENGSSTSHSCPGYAHLHSYCLVFGNMMLVMVVSQLELMENYLAGNDQYVRSCFTGDSFHPQFSLGTLVIGMFIAKNFRYGNL